MNILRGDYMKFRVYEIGTNKDVTDKGDFFIDKNGKLLCDAEERGIPIYLADNRYYYKLEIDVVSK